MRKMLVIAVREYQAAVRTKAFLITLFLMPVMMGGSIVVQMLMKDRVDTHDKRFAVVDRTGRLFDAIAQAARERNENDIFEDRGETRKQTKPRFLVEEVKATTDDDAELTLEMSERIRNKELLGFVIIEPDAIEPGADAKRAAVLYHSNSPTYDDFLKWVSPSINERIQQLRFEAAHLDPDIVRQATRRTRIANLGLVKRDEAGHITEAKASNEKANIIVPMGLMMLMFMVVMVGASPLIQSVLEEKMQRIAEVLLGSVSPFQLMMGKLLGTVGVSLTIGTLYLGGAFYAVGRAGYAELLPTHIIVWFVVFQSLAVLMFGSVFIAIGAAVTDLKEAQALTTPVMIVVVSPLFVWLNVVREPSSTFSLVASLIPPATPMLMTIRQTVPPGVPLWQPMLGIVLVLLTTTLCVFAAGRIFRVGILMQGKGAKMGEMLRWVIRG